MYGVIQEAQARLNETGAGRRSGGEIWWLDISRGQQTDACAATLIPFAAPEKLERSGVRHPCGRRRPRAPRGRGRGRRRDGTLVNSVSGRSRAGTRPLSRCQPSRRVGSHPGGSHTCRVANEGRRRRPGLRQGRQWSYLGARQISGLLSPGLAGTARRPDSAPLTAPPATCSCARQRSRP